MISLWTASVSLFESSSAQLSSDQMKISMAQRAQTIARVVSVPYRFCLPFLINRVLNLTRLRRVIPKNIRSDW